MIEKKDMMKLLIWKLILKDEELKVLNERCEDLEELENELNKLRFSLHKMNEYVMENVALKTSVFRLKTILCCLVSL